MFASARKSTPRRHPRSACLAVPVRLLRSFKEGDGYFFFPALIFAQRALAAARIRAKPAAEMRRFGRTVPGLLCAALLCLAQRALCAAAMRRRAAVDIVRFGDALGAPPFSEVRTAIALSIRSRSCWRSLITASRFDMRGILQPARNPTIQFTATIAVRSN